MEQNDFEDEDGNHPLTAAEEIELENYIKDYGNPVSEQKHNAHSILHEVLTSTNTLKTGNLSEIEVGAIRLPVRTVQEFSLISDKLCEDSIMKEYFDKESEIITASSLSKDAKLITLAVIQKKEWMTSSKPAQKQNKSWFKKKDSNQLSDYQS